MDHDDHVGLIRGGVPGPGGVWADLGSGSGAFTLALADLLGPAGVIHSVDRRADALREQQRAMRARFPRTTVEYHVADYSRPLALPPLDGVVMANALHFQTDREKETVLRVVRGYLRPGGRLILVEYNTDQGNRWAPYPLSCASWEALATRCGLVSTHLLATRPSRFLREIYSALSFNPA